MSREYNALVSFLMALKDSSTDIPVKFNFKYFVVLTKMRYYEIITVTL